MFCAHDRVEAPEKKAFAMEGDTGDILVGVILSPVLCVSRKAMSNNPGTLKGKEKRLAPRL